MQSNQFIEEMGLLAELSYVNFRDISLSKNNIDWISNAKDDIRSDKDAREEVLIKLLETYEIVDFQSFDGLDESDLQMMLLKDKSTGEYVISYRGTAGFHDLVITDFAQMGLKLNDNDQFKDSLTVTNYWKELYGLNTSNTTLSGHSLGGALAQLNSYVFGFETYTINAFGFDAATIGGTINMEAVLYNIGYRNMGVQNTDNIYNFISESGIFRDFVSGDLTDIVGYFNYTHIEETIILKDSTGGYLGLMGSHSSIDINNTLEIYHYLMEAFSLNDNYNIITNIIDKYKVELQGNQMKDFLEDLSKILNVSLTSDLKSFSQNIKNLEQNYTIKELSTKTQTQLQDKTLANLYALENLNPFVIEGDFEVYNNIDVSKYTDQYLEDRATYLYYLLDKKNRYDIDPKLTMTAYEDVELGSEYTLEQSFSKSKIVFGGDSDNTLIGSDGSDRLYAGLGNDTIEAGTGTNYIDGGAGIDTISYKNITNSNKEGINVNLSLVTAQTINSTITDTLINIENVIGSKYADNITGKDNTTTTLYGGNGNDTLKGGNNSENILLGEDDDDRIVGGTTTDEIMLNANKLVMNYLDGGNGKDYLIAGKNANNYLYGGAGNDTLVSTLIGFKNESAGIDYSKGSSYLNGGEGIDTYVVKDYVTIEDDDGRGEIQTKYGKLQDLTIKTLSDGTILLLKNNPMYLDIETIYAPLAGYGSGAFNNILGNVGTTTQGMSLTNYELIFKLQKDGNDLILNDLTFNPTVIRIKNYTANSLNLNITQDMLDNLPSLDENINPTPTNPTLIGTNESETLIGSEINNTFISNAGDDILKDISGGNDIYKFKKGDGADTIYDIKGNDTIIFDETVLKEDITFSQSEDLKSLIINYSPTDSITITNYFDSFSKIENIQLSNGEKLIPEFNTQTIGKNQAENIVTGYGNDTVTSNQGDDTIKDLSGNDIYIFKVGDGNDTIEDLDGIDKIVFENLSNDDLIFTQKDNNLIINYSTSDSVTILNYFDNTTSNYLEKIAFKNDLETIDASNIITGTVNDDEINGTYFDDVITSNKGNDTLKGSYGNDTYKFSKGDGNNRIYDVKGDDTITFDETINKEDISFIIKDNNLLITYSATDTIEVLNYFDNTNKIENIKLFTGEIVQITNIDKTLTGSQQNDTLIGSYGDDILIGNDGDDTLTGNVGKDKLYGGSGFDTYVASHGDIINDSDNLGKIIFEGETLSTAIYDENKKVYVSSIGEYSLEDTTLTFTSNAGKKLIIENFDKNSYSLGINLTNEGRTFSSQTLYSNVLVVDLNKDGFVNTNSLSNSNTYFDITNTNFKNKTQWLDNSDGFLVFDKNSDGIINSSDELFGNLSKSGFKELEELIDLNYDNKIDRKDSMFYQLKVWQDLNSDGISTSNELFDLIDVGISSINLNTSQRDATDTNITIDEASTYKTLNGTNELIANVKLNYDPNKSLSSNSNFENKNIDQIIQTLPKLRGYGTVENSTIAYTLNEDLKNLATQIITPLKLSENFDKFLSSCAKNAHT